MNNKKMLIRCTVQNRGLYYIATPLFEILNKNNIEFCIWPLKEHNNQVQIKQIKDTNSYKFDIAIFFELLDGVKNVNCEKILFVPMWEWLIGKTKKTLIENEKIDIICPTKCCYNLIKSFNLKNNLMYCPWTAPIDITNHKLRHRAKNFLLIGGKGFNDRKNVNISIEAIEILNAQIENNNCQFIITSQSNQNFHIDNISNNIKIINDDLPRNKIIELIDWTDVTINLSKVEGVGIPLLESIFSYSPVITSNCPPMNEIIENDRGWLCDGIITKTNYADSIILNTKNISELISSVLGIEIYEKSKNCMIFSNLINKNFNNFWKSILLN